MRTISAVDLRNDLEGIVKSLKRGEHMELTYRGETVGQLLPSTKETKSAADAALDRLSRRHANDPEYAQKVEKYIQEVYEDRRSYGSRQPPE
jgi:antitoxin (DNA-binding transcriptional repressor) of toxin-antitoxin stability system